MNNQTVAEYLNIQQVRDMFNFDLPQLKHAVSKNELRLWAYIGDKKRAFDKQPVSVIDLNYVGMPSVEEIKRLDKLTVQEIEAEGWSITHLLPPHNFIAHKGELCFMVTHENGVKGFRLPIIDDGNVVEHDGFIEIDYEKNPFDKERNLEVLFNKNELYLGQGKSNKSGHICLLKPGCYITLNDVYIHHDELKKLRKKSGKTLQMLPHIRSSNLLKRADHIANLFNQICVEHPVRIEIEKITKPTQLINLAWIIAFCRMGYNSYGDVSYKDFALNAMAENIRKSLIDELQKSGELHKLNAKYYDEVDFATETTVTSTLSHNLPPSVIKSLLQNNDKYCMLIHAPDDPKKSEVSQADVAVTALDPMTREQSINNMSAQSEITEQGNPKKFRQDPIAQAVIEIILPELLPDKNAPTSTGALNKLKRATFEQIKSALEKKGEMRVTYKAMNKFDSSYLCVNNTRTTYGAFRKRFDNLLDVYLNNPTCSHQPQPVSLKDIKLGGVKTPQ